MKTRAEAQHRIDQIHAFGAELAELRAAGVFEVAAAQRQALEDYHKALEAELQAGFDVDASTHARQLSLGMRIASLLGALSLAASAFLFFYRYWGRLETGAQIAILVGAPLLTFSFTVWLRARDASGYFTKLAALVAFACFVLNLSMLGQIFDVTPSDTAFLAWGGFAAILAYGVDSRLLLIAAILSLDGYVAARVGTWGGGYWLDVGRHPENFMPFAALLLSLPRLADASRHEGFAASYRVFGLLTLYLPMLALANWGEGSYLPLASGVIEGGYQVAGFLVSALAIHLGVRHDRAEVVNTSVAFFVVLLYTKLYDWWWQIMPKYLFFLVLGLTAVLVLMVLRRLRAAGHGAAGGAP